MERKKSAKILYEECHIKHQIHKKRDTLLQDKISDILQSPLKKPKKITNNNNNNNINNSINNNN